MLQYAPLGKKQTERQTAEAAPEWKITWIQLKNKNSTESKQQHHVMQCLLKDWTTSDYQEWQERRVACLDFPHIKAFSQQKRCQRKGPTQLSPFPDKIALCVWEGSSLSVYLSILCSCGKIWLVSISVVFGSSPICFGSVLCCSNLTQPSNVKDYTESSWFTSLFWIYAELMLYIYMKISNVQFLTYSLNWYTPPKTCFTQ